MLPRKLLPLVPRVLPRVLLSCGAGRLLRLRLKDLPRLKDRLRVRLRVRLKLRLRLLDVPPSPPPPPSLFFFVFLRNPILESLELG